MKLACADFTFPLLPLDKAFDLIAALKFSGVDLGLFEGRGSLWPSREFKSPSRAGEALRRRLNARGLKLADLFIQSASDFASTAVNNPEASVRQRSRDMFGRALDYVRAAGGAHITMLPGIQWPGETPAASLKRSAVELAWYAATAEAAKIRFSVEAHLGSHIATPQRALKLIRMTPGLTLTLDYGHFAYQGIPDARVHPLIAHASHFHARGASRKHLQSSLKHNTINYRAILKKMHRTGYAGWMGVEYVWVDWEHCNEVDNLSETLLLRDHLIAADRSVR